MIKPDGAEIDRLRASGFLFDGSRRRSPDRVGRGWGDGMMLLCQLELAALDLAEAGLLALLQYLAKDGRVNRGLRRLAVRAVFLGLGRLAEDASRLAPRRRRASARLYPAPASQFCGSAARGRRAARKGGIRWVCRTER